MAKKITINLAKANPKDVAPLTADGTVAWIKTGNVKTKFFLHKVEQHWNLTHYATGARVAHLSGYILRSMGRGRVATPRGAAVMAIADLEKRFGSTAILDRTKPLPILNP